MDNIVHSTAGDSVWIVQDEHEVRGFLTHIGQEALAQLPPTLRGVRVLGTKPREVALFQGWCVCGVGCRVGAAEVVASDG